MSIRFVCSRGFPTVGLQDTANIGFTRKLNVITSLVHVYTIVTRLHSSFSPNANALIFGGNPW